MIGFDIVSLSESAFPSDDRRDAYADKVLTEAELAWWATQPDQFVSLWKLWTIKESVYKVESKLGGERLLIPRKYEVMLRERGEDGNKGIGKESEIKGTLGVYFAISHEEEDCVYSAVAQTREELHNIRMAHFPLQDDNPDFQSMAVHQQLAEFLEQNPDITKGLTAESSLDISVSHHGLWGGFAICPVV